MIVFNPCQNGSFREQTEEHVVIFVSFDHEGSVLTQSGIRMQIDRDGTNDEPGFFTQFGQHPAQHTGGCSFTVGANDCDHIAVIQKLTQKFIPAHRRQVAFFGFNPFRIVLRDGGRKEHQVSFSDIFSLVTDLNTDSGCFKIGDDF